MTERTSDEFDEPDPAHATVRLQRRLPEVDVPIQANPGRADDKAVTGNPSTSDSVAPDSGPTNPAAADAAPVRPPSPERDPAEPSGDDGTIDLRKRDTETVRVDREPPSPWAPSAQPTTAYPPNPGGSWPAAPPPSSWPAQSPPPAAQPPAWSGQPPQPWSAPPSWAAQSPPPWSATRALPQPPPQLPPHPPAHRSAASPPLPPVRGRGHGPLIVFGILAVLIIAGGAWALVSLAVGSSPFGPDAEDPRDRVPYTAAPVPSDPGLPVDPTATPGPAPSGGPTGQVVVGWTLSGVDYRATLTTAGATGSAEVTYTDPSSGPRTIRQDLTLASSDGRTAYVGSNVVDVDTGAPATDYAADIFLLATNAEGNVYITEVCDTSARCAPATIE